MAWNQKTDGESKSAALNNPKGVHTARERVEGGADIFGSPNFGGDGFDAERAGCGLNLAHVQHGGGIADIGQDRQSAESGDDLP